MNLDSVCELIVDAEHKTAPRVESGGYPSIRTPNIGKGRLKMDGVYRVSDETYKKWTRRAIPQENDLILAREAPVGNVAIVPKGIKPCLGQRTVLLRPNSELINPNFLCYYLLSDEIQNKMTSRSGGATVAHLNMKDIRELELDFVPSLPIQKKIADILGAYDDLIENNFKRIKLLEETAQNIYKEWFVNFRFPNHENTPIDDESGLPEGWGKECLDNLCIKISSGGTPNRKTKEYWDDAKYDWVTTKELKDCFVFKSAEAISEIGLEKSSAKLFPIGTVVMAIYASPTLGRLGILTKESCFNQAAVGFDCNNQKISNHFLYYTLHEERGNLNALAIGAAQQNINVKKVKDHKVTIPTVDIVEEFTKVVESNFKLRKSLGIQNIRLKEARDILLPRLMNRTIEV